MPSSRNALLIDDDLPAVERVRALLPSREVKVESTANVQEAIDCLEQHTYCGVVINLDLANSGGMAILRSLSDRNRVPVVLICSSIPEELYELDNVDDVKLVLTPPFEPSLLASLILGLCGIER